MNVYESIFKKFGLSPTQLKILELTEDGSRVLEIGSSTGYMTKAFLDKSCTVDVAEKDLKAASKLPRKIRRIFKGSIEDAGIFKDLGKYDYIIMADVLEHLVNPDEVLKNLLKISSANTKLIISLPNVASWPMRKQLFLKGDFEYQESGLLDKTHLHFYTVETLPKILSENGWQTDKIIGTVTRLPFEELTGRIPYLYPFLVEKYKNLAYYHFLAIASKK